MAYDNICRYLTTEYASSFVNWLLDLNTNNIELLPTELKLDPIRSDALYFLPKQQQILHLEFQTVPTSIPASPLRMLDYWVRIYREYECPIEQVVIFLKQTNSEAVYVEQFAVGNTVHRYRVVRIWEQNPASLLTTPGLIPLATLAQTNNPEVLLRQIAAQVDMIEEPEEQRNISACVEVLASLKFDRNLIKQYLREDLMRESPIYQEILQEGMQRGLQQGKCDTAIRLLARRIGTVKLELQNQIQQLSITQLDELSEALLDFSNEADLVAWLQSHS